MSQLSFNEVSLVYPPRDRHAASQLVLDRVTVSLTTANLSWLSDGPAPARPAFSTSLPVFWSQPAGL